MLPKQSVSLLNFTSLTPDRMSECTETTNADYDSNLVNKTNLVHNSSLAHLSIGDRGSTVVKVLCHKSDGRWFDPS